MPVQGQMFVGSPAHARVWALLCRHVGRDRAIGQAELARQLDMPPRLVRRLIFELVVEVRRPICSAYGRGYYLPANDEEAFKAADALTRHALAMLKRASVLRRMTQRAMVLDLLRNSEGKHAS